MICSLGLDCDASDCPNRFTCHAWTIPWPLPYLYKSEESALYIDILPYSGYGGFEDIELNLPKIWGECGFANAVELPYVYSKNTLLVLRNTWPSFRKAWDLPYGYSRLEDGCGCLEVNYNLLQVPYSNHAARAGFLVPCPLALDELPF